MESLGTDVMPIMEPERAQTPYCVLGVPLGALAHRILWSPEKHHV